MLTKFEAYKITILEKKTESERDEEFRREQYQQAHEQYAKSYHQNFNNSNIQKQFDIWKLIYVFFCFYIFMSVFAFLFGRKSRKSGYYEQDRHGNVQYIEQNRFQTHRNVYPNQQNQQNQQNRNHRKYGPQQERGDTRY